MAALVLPSIPPGCSQAPTLQHPAPSPTDTVPATVPLSPITDFSLPAFVSQLFGFVYACYVSKVFLEEEDSCKCFCCQLWWCRESCRVAKWPWLAPQHPTRDGAVMPGALAGKGIPLVGMRQMCWDVMCHPVP